MKTCDQCVFARAQCPMFRTIFCNSFMFDTKTLERLRKREEKEINKSEMRSIMVEDSKEGS
jgi:hypothetical protein